MWSEWVYAPGYVIYAGNKVTFDDYRVRFNLEETTLERFEFKTRDYDAVLNIGNYEFATLVFEREE